MPRMERRPTWRSALAITLTFSCVAVGILTLPLGCASGGSGSGDAGSSAENLAPRMSDVHRYSMKLGHAIQTRHPRLASFYAGEVAQSLEQIRDTFPEHEGYPVAELIDQIALPSVLPLQGTTRREAWEESERLYGVMIDKCNACHAATEREFLVVEVPSGPPPDGQAFTPD